MSQKNRGYRSWGAYNRPASNSRSRAPFGTRTLGWHATALALNQLYWTVLWPFRKQRPLHQACQRCESPPPGFVDAGTVYNLAIDCQVDICLSQPPLGVVRRVRSVFGVLLLTVRTAS